MILLAFLYWGFEGLMGMSVARHILDGDMVNELRASFLRRAGEIGGFILFIIAALGFIALAGWHADDPSLTYATGRAVQNPLGFAGSAFADLSVQLFGFGVLAVLLPLVAWGWRLVTRRGLDNEKIRLAAWLASPFLFSGAFSSLPRFEPWPLQTGLGGAIGDAMLSLAGLPFQAIFTSGVTIAAGLILTFSGTLTLVYASALLAEPVERDVMDDEAIASGVALFGLLAHLFYALRGFVMRSHKALTARESAHKQAYAERGRQEPHFGTNRESGFAPSSPEVPQQSRIEPAVKELRRGKREIAEAQTSWLNDGDYVLPPLSILTQQKRSIISLPDEESLEQNVKMLESVLDDFGVKGEIIHVRPGPVVTLYELQPAPGIKSSRVIGLADDIARSMSAISVRVAVVPGRNVIGIELPNARREMVYLRELLASKDFEEMKGRLPLCLGKTIGGEPVITDLARMPHLLIAGTTGSGKSVAINTMILSLLYRLNPDQCKLIMIDPKMLELSVYDGIPHLLSPVVTDPKKAVVALKWTVREMEERYRKMSKLGVRNIDGFNARVEQAIERGEVLTRTVQTGFDRESGEAIYEKEEMPLEPMPYIVVIVDEMADLMLVAGKDIEGAVQRLAQMARAAGIHIIMATQRPSVDVITGTIKANFPTRVSFQVTSKIDSRTILGEQGAEQLLGQGDMLYMAGGGRISRVHGPFVSDEEVLNVVKHLKKQGQPAYLEEVTAEEEEEFSADGNVFDKTSFGESEGGDLYSQAVAIVLRDKKASTSYIQRRLQIGYNRAATLMERMEQEGVVSAANHAGKREILAETENVD
jgi:S-DNA-T family DNA segregation ATPase FtsK/SpoIIIE